ncbi:uncharacterized protein LOC120519013 isoform X2 [Polypterus senegalus]|uniref:uncharacterized protein LOC120519013 isoform X2 n=1 Tax=Polypterus senegalus TaxID=55291 RepID=UPI0019657959|nr:uncharacterized protein LOC120519013 isoform X2 [Polypterus senegalus]
MTTKRKGKEIFEGGEVEMSCNVDGNPLKWKYELYKTGDKYPYGNQMKKKFYISPVTPSDSGEYKCRAVKDDLHSRFSEPVELRVSVSEVTRVKATPSYKEVTTVNAPLPYKDLTTVKAPPSYKEVTTVKASSSYTEMTTVNAPPSYKAITVIASPSYTELSVENEVRLAISGLVLIVLLIIVAEFLWSRSNKAVSTSGQAESESNTNL